jgi:hypothetical protein
MIARNCTKGEYRTKEGDPLDNNMPLVFFKVDNLRTN